MDTPGGKSEMRGRRDERDMTVVESVAYIQGGRVLLLSSDLGVGTLCRAYDQGCEECEPLLDRVVCLATGLPGG